MQWPGIIGLGEMMNFPGVINGDPQMLAEMAATMRAGKTVGGHYASPDQGHAFPAYAAGGPADDHEGTAEADAIARVRLGHALDDAPRARPGTMSKARSPRSPKGASTRATSSSAPTTAIPARWSTKAI